MMRPIFDLLYTKIKNIFNMKLNVCGVKSHIVEVEGVRARSASL